MNALNCLIRELDEIITCSYSNARAKHRPSSKAWQENARRCAQARSWALDIESKLRTMEENLK